MLGAALHFVAEAKKHGVEVVITRFTSAAGQILLDLPAAIKQARDYRLDIPANLKFHEYVDCSIPQDVFIPHDIPVFWQNGNITLFYGPGHMAILRNLLRAFLEKTSNTPDDVPDPQGTDMQDGVSQYVFPKKKVGLLYPPSVTTRINKLVKASKAAIPRISSAILRDEDADALEMALSQNGIDVGERVVDTLDLLGIIKTSDKWFAKEQKQKRLKYLKQLMKGSKGE